jgi:hypothetical protein
MPRSAVTTQPIEFYGFHLQESPGDYAGRLIEAVGLMGYKPEHAQLQPLPQFYYNDDNLLLKEPQPHPLGARRVKEQLASSLSRN